LMIPHEEPEGRAVITEVIADTPAAEAGLLEGDVILEVEGRDAGNLVEASRYVRVYQGQTLDILVRRGGEHVLVSVYARWDFPSGQGPTGITIAPEAVNPVDGRPFTMT